MLDHKTVFGLISEAEFAEMRQCEISTLTNERYKHKGPPWTRLGKKIFYPLKGIKAYIAAGTVVPKPKPATLIDGAKPKKSPPKKAAKAKATAKKAASAESVSP